MGPNGMIWEISIKSLFNAQSNHEKDRASVSGEAKTESRLDSRADNFKSDTASSSLQKHSMAAER